VTVCCSIAIASASLASELPAFTYTDYWPSTNSQGFHVDIPTFRYVTGAVKDHWAVSATWYFSSSLPRVHLVTGPALRKATDKRFNLQYAKLAHGLRNVHTLSIELRPGTTGG